MGGTDGIESQVRVSVPDAVPHSARDRRVWFIIASALLLLIVAAFLAWDNTYGVSAERRAKDAADRAQSERYRAYVKTFEDAMRADTYGGATPEETLRMFVSALKAGDLDLASKYFMLETNENSPDYLTHNRWKSGLEETEVQGRLDQIITWVLAAEPTREQSTSDKDASWFSVYDTSSSISFYEIYLKRNTYSNIWKIQSM